MIDGGALDAVTTGIRTARRVFLFCSPTALVLWGAFGATYLWSLVAVLVVLSVYVTAWTLTREERDPGIVETAVVAWFYNLVVSGAAVLGVRYGAFGVAFVLGLPAVATLVRGRVLAPEGNEDPATGRRVS